MFGAGEPHPERPGAARPWRLVEEQVRGVAAVRRALVDAWAPSGREVRATEVRVPGGTGAPQLERAGEVLDPPVRVIIDVVVLSPALTRRVVSVGLGEHIEIACRRSGVRRRVEWTTIGLVDERGIEARAVADGARDPSIRRVVLRRTVINLVVDSNRLRVARVDDVARV